MLLPSPRLAPVMTAMGVMVEVLVEEDIVGTFLEVSADSRDTAWRRLEEVPAIRHTV